MNRTETGIVGALAIGVPAIIEFQTYSSWLSSPWTTGKLIKGGEDEEHFWDLFLQATLSSFLFTAVTGGMLAWGTGQVWPLLLSLVSVAGISAWMYFAYKEAIDG